MSVAMKPILFSTPMVQAILDGRKTMTRRVVKENNKMEQITLDRLCGICGFFDQETMNYGCTHKECGETVEDINGKEHGRCFSWSCPFGQEWGYESDCESSFDGDTYMNIPIPSYQVGDVLWVRETWTYGRVVVESDEYGKSEFWLEQTQKEEDEKCIFYKADMDEAIREGISFEDVFWKPSIFMPKEACRIFLRVTNVRVERLQDMPHDDVYAEGFPDDFYKKGGKNFRHWFVDLWNSINGKGAWEANPFVFVYEFQRVEKPKEMK